ncbi:MAG: TldD/PmbA family protein [bacterium]|nr:TldD/PmbA family protein [bacterium]
MDAQHAQKKLSQWMDAAKVAGADQCDGVVSDGRSLSVDVRQGQVEQTQFSESVRGALRVFVGQKVASVSTSDLGKDDLTSSAERAVAMARVLPEDEYAGLADPSLLASEKTLKQDLDLFDSKALDISTLVERAKTCEAAALSVKGITNSYGSGAAWGDSRFYLGTSEGFFGGIEKSRHSLSAGVLAQNKDGSQVVDGEGHSTLFFDDLEAPELVGRKAGEKTVRELNPRAVKTISVPVIFDPDVAGSLLGHFVGAISGVEVAMNISFLKDQMGEQVFHPGITIVDDPLRVRGLASSVFDGEGVQRTKRVLVEEGRLESWLLDRRSAHQLGLKTTGHASRGMGSPSPTPTNCFIQPGAQTPEQMISGIDQGFYVTNFLGSSVNPVTGDYSRGARGLWIEKGELSYAVSEVTIAGRLQDMFKNLTPANDLRFRRGLDTPTLRVDGLTVAGL